MFFNSKYTMCRVDIILNRRLWQVMIAATCTLGCSSEVELAPPPAQSSPAIAHSNISSVALPETSSSFAKQFERLGPKRTGIDFVNRIDTQHPLKRLYVGGFGCGGVAIGDVNGDRRPDIYVVSGPEKNRLFIQEQGLKFRDVTSRAGVDGDEHWGVGASLADVDNDGDLDLFVCNYDAPNQLYINRGDGTFSDEARLRGVDLIEPSLSAAFCDYDRDGDLDFYLLTNRFHRAGGRPDKPPTHDKNGKREILPEFAKYYHVQRDAKGKYTADAYGRADRLFRNDGKGRFRDVTESSGIVGHGQGLSQTWWDYDRDGWPDLYVGNDFDDPDKLYHNNGDGTFTDVLKQAVPHTSWFSMGAACGDLNNDGLLDLLSLDMSSTTHYMQKTTMGKMNAQKLREVAGPPPQIMRNALLVNSGGDRFLEAAYLAGLADSNWSWSAKCADLNNDGLQDVFISNGMARSFNNADISSPQSIGITEWARYENSPTRTEQNLVFQNVGQLRFRDTSKSWGLDHVGMSYAVAVGDLDVDGDLDLVVANLDQPLAIYRNNAGGNRLTLKLIGTHSNLHGLGSRIDIETRDGMQVRELSPMAGFQASDQPLVHFGLGTQESVRRMTVRWPSGLVQSFDDLPANQSYTVTEPMETPPELTRPSRNHARAESDKTLFHRSNSLNGMKHIDREYDDFAAQPLLPNKLSQLGPGIATGDVDNDGDIDFFFGQGAGIPGLMLINKGTGDYQAADVMGDDRTSEDLASLLFDADGDGDLDLFVVSGSVECDAGAALLQDRLYLNDGAGGFAKAPAGTLPDLRDSGSCVVAADFDHDNDLDLFIGGRSIPGKYPLAPRSHLLRNDDGIFTDVTEAIAPGLQGTGLVTGALWSDADGDGWVDLLVTHEWGPVKLWRNDHGRLVDGTKAAGLGEHLGWFNGVAGRDLDNDGDIDYVVTNFGLNTKYHASPEHPALLYYGDFENNGKFKLVEAEYEQQTLFPVRGKSCSTHAMPLLGKKFATYHDFATASLSDIYTPACLQQSHRFAATRLESGVLLNDGRGHFDFRPLPRIAQISPSFGVALTDVDGDGNCDCYIVQNFFGPQPETGRMDGGLSLLLTGNGDGTFVPMWPDRSGLIVSGDAKSLVTTDLNDDGWPDFVVGINNDDVVSFVNKHPSKNRVFNVRLKGKPGNPTAVGATVAFTTDDGTIQTAEVFAGSGYLSQSSAILTFGLGAARKPVKAQIRWPNGQVSSHQITDANSEATFEQP